MNTPKHHKHNNSSSTSSQQINRLCSRTNKHLRFDYLSTNGKHHQIISPPCGPNGIISGSSQELMVEAEELEELEEELLSNNDEDEG